MADTRVTREVVRDRNGFSTFITWVALILAIAALTLAWLAYNRTGEDLESRIQRQVEQTINETRDTTPDNTQDTTPAPSPQPTAPTDENPNQTDTQPEGNPDTTQ